MTRPGNSKNEAYRRHQARLKGYLPPTTPEGIKRWWKRREELEKLANKIKWLIGEPK